MELTEKISRILALGLYDKMTEVKLPDNIDSYVAAGNPGKFQMDFPEQVNSMGSFMIGKSKCHTKDFFHDMVSGNSMLTDGIRSGHELLSRPIKDIEEVCAGDFIIIDVDKEFYKFRHHGRLPYFKKKLRRAIGEVFPGETAEQIEGRLTGTFAEPFSKKERKDLRDSLAEARSFYGDERLYMSITYHDGDVHYSYHPVMNIRSKVYAIAYKSDGSTVFIETSNLYN